MTSLERLRLNEKELCSVCKKPIIYHNKLIECIGELSEKR